MTVFLVALHLIIALPCQPLPTIWDAPFCCVNSMLS